MTLIGGPGNNGNKGVLHIPQSSSPSGTSQPDCLVSYQDTRGGCSPSAEVQSVYSTAPADWAIRRVKFQNSFISDNSV